MHFCMKFGLSFFTILKEFISYLTEEQTLQHFTKSFIALGTKS